MHAQEIKLRLHSEMKKYVIHSTSQRIDLTYEETMNINGNPTSVQLCENCFVNLHDQVSKKTYANWKQDLKKRIAYDAAGSTLLTSLSQAKKVKDFTKLK
jgi:hypothetical protein